MKVEVDIHVSIGSTSVHVGIESGTGYSRQEPIIGAIEKAMAQARQTAVAVIKEQPDA